MPEVELRIAARPALVRTARQVAVTLARRVGLDDEAVDEVRLAVGEAAGLGVALAAANGGSVVLRYVDDDGLQVTVDAPGSLPVATGPEAADVLSAAVDGVGGADGSDPLPAGSTLMVLTSVVPSTEVRTGPSGLVVRLAWK